MMQNQLNILYEDQEILVLVKPHGTATQSQKIGSPDMVNLIKRYLFLKDPRRGEPYVGLIHRLDQPVKGILVFAKTKAAAANLSRQLAGGSDEAGFHKIYHAVVDGCPPKPEGDLHQYIVSENKNNTSKLCDRSMPGAKKAHLSYKVLSTTESEGRTRSELLIHLDTGRKHQIRVQLAGMGCPIVGDTKYNPSARKNVSSHGRKWQELKLCAVKLSFRHPKTGEVMNFEIEP